LGKAFGVWGPSLDEAHEETVEQGNSWSIDGKEGVSK